MPRPFSFKEKGRFPCQTSKDLGLLRKVVQDTPGFRRLSATWRDQGKGEKKIVPNIPWGFLGSEHEVQRPISCWNSLGIGVSCKYQIHSDTASIATWNHNFSSPSEES